MYWFRIPDYKKDNIINLMSSISNSFGNTHDYNTLDSLSPWELDNYKNIVLIAVDALWYNYLAK